MEEKKERIKRLLTGLVTMALILTALPMSAFASPDLEPAGVVEEAQEETYEGGIENEACLEADEVADDNLNDAAFTVSFNYAADEFTVEAGEGYAAISDNKVTVSANENYGFSVLTNKPGITIKSVSANGSSLTISENGLYYTGEVTGDLNVSIESGPLVPPVSECNITISGDGVASFIYTISHNGMMTDGIIWNSGQITVSKNDILNINKVNPADGYVSGNTVISVDGNPVSCSKNNDDWNGIEITVDTTIVIAVKKAEEPVPVSSCTVGVGGEGWKSFTYTTTKDSISKTWTASENKVISVSRNDSVYISDIVAEEGYTSDNTAVKANDKDVEKGSDGVYSVKIEENTVITITNTKKEQPVPENPVYETKLGFENNKAITFYSGQKDEDKDYLTLATAKFSAATTVKKIEYAYLDIKTSDGNIIKYCDVISDNKIVYKNTGDMPAGKGKLHIVAASDGTTIPAEAALKVTVKDGVNYIYVDLPSDRVFKADGKPVSIKASASAYHDYYEGFWRSVKIKSRLEWKLFEADQKTEIKDGITVKNGKITIAKNYSPSDNQVFYVQAGAKDYEGNTTVSTMKKITIRTSQIVIDKVVISDNIAATTGIDLDEAHSSKDFEGKYITAIDKGGKMIDPSDLSFSYPKKSIAVYRFRDCICIDKILKPGKITISLKSPGMKGSKKVTLNVKAGKASGYELTIVDADDKRQGVSANSTVSNDSAGEIWLWTDPIADSICNNNTSISVVKGGVVSGSRNKHYIYFYPTAAETVVEVKNGGKTLYTCTIINNMYNFPDTVGIRQKDDTKFYVGDFKDSYFTLTGLPSLSTGEYVNAEILPDSNITAGQWKNYSVFFKAVEGEVDDNNELHIWFASKKLKAGQEYSLEVVFYKGNENTDEITYLSSPQTVTFTSVKAPGAPKLKLKNNKITMEKKAGVSENLVFKETNIAERYITKLYNNKKGNEANNFLNYFELSPDKKALVLKKSLTPEEISAVRAEDLTGWIEYFGLNAAYKRTEVIRTKITVKLK